MNHNRPWLVIVGWLVLTIFALTAWSSFFHGLRVGVLAGALLVVFVLYPTVLRRHEDRLAELESRRGFSEVD